MDAAAQTGGFIFTLVTATLPHKPLRHPKRIATAVKDCDNRYL